MMSTWYSKHVEAWNKLILKQKFCASIWLITEIYTEMHGQQNIKNYIDVLYEGQSIINLKVCLPLLKQG